MNKEETKKAIEIMIAYCDGKKIQAMYRGQPDLWGETTNPTWDFNKYEYRIKPEAKVRPYTQNDFIEATKKHGSFIYALGKKGWCSECCYNISYCDATAVKVGDSFHTYDELLKMFIWADDRTSCGIIEEE